MTPEQILQIGEKLSALPLHAILLIAVIVLWLELRKTRQALDGCLKGNALNAQRIGALEDHTQVDESSYLP
jgi:hypothetical protein